MRKVLMLLCIGLVSLIFVSCSKNNTLETKQLTEKEKNDIISVVKNNLRYDNVIDMNITYDDNNNPILNIEIKGDILKTDITEEAASEICSDINEKMGTLPIGYFITLVDKNKELIATYSNGSFQFQE